MDMENKSSDSTNSDSLVHKETFFIIKTKHLHDIARIMSNSPDLSPYWYMLATELIPPSDWPNIRNEEEFLVKIFKTLEYWIFRKGINATFDVLLRVVENYSKNAKDELLDNFKKIQSDEGIRPNVEIENKIKIPLFWKVPERNINFTTRREIFKNLESKINSEVVQDSTCKIVLISMSGCGKSSIATEFLYKYKEKFSNIFWLRAENESQLTSQYVQIGQKLKFNQKGEKGGEKLFVQTLIEEWFENPINSNWILVYDNAQDQKEISNLIPKKGGFVIITSINRLWTNVHKIEFEGFSPEESIEFIEKSLLQSDLNLLQYANIPKELGNMPLAIALAMNYINTYQISPLDYLHLLENYTKDVLEFNSEGLVDKSIYISIKISLDNIDKINHLAYEWLEICSYMRSDRIDRVYLEQFIQDKGLSTRELLAVQKIILQYCIVKYNCNDGYFLIHRLVQKAIQISQTGNNLEGIYFQCAKFIFEKAKNPKDLTDYGVYDDTIHLLQFVIPYTTKMCQIILEQEQGDDSELKLSIKRLNSLINKLVVAVYMPDIGSNLYSDYFEKISQILLEPMDSHILYFNMGRELIKKFGASVSFFDKSIDIVNDHLGRNHVYTLKIAIQIAYEAVYNKDYQKVFDYTAKIILIYNAENITAKYDRIFMKFVKFLMNDFNISIRIIRGFDENEMLDIIRNCDENSWKWPSLESKGLLLKWLINNPSLCNQIREELYNDLGEDEINIFLHNDLPEYSETE